MADTEKTTNPLVEAYIAANKADLDAFNAGWAEERKRHEAEAGSMRVRFARHMIRFALGLGSKLSLTSLEDFRARLVDDAKERCTKLGCTIGTYGVYATQTKVGLWGSYRDTGKLDAICAAAGLDTEGNVVGEAPNGALKAIYDKYSKSNGGKKASPEQVATKYFSELSRDGQMMFVRSVIGEEAIHEFIDALLALVEGEAETDEAVAA